MADNTIGDLPSETSVDRSTALIEVETNTPASRKMTIRDASGVGWVYLKDSNYTSSSMLSVNNTIVQLTNDELGSGTVTTYAPKNAAGSSHSLWSSNRINAATVGDVYTLRADFKAVTTTPSAYFDLRIDDGTATPNYIIQHLFPMTKGTGTVHEFSVSFPIFADATFVANGAKIMIDSSISNANLSVYDIAFFIKRDYAVGL
jgi:hypothetical protein